MFTSKTDHKCLPSLYNSLNWQDCDVFFALFISNGAQDSVKGNDQFQKECTAAIVIKKHDVIYSTLI